MININLLPFSAKTKTLEAKKTANIFSICLVIVLFFFLFCFIAFEIDGILKLNLSNTNADITKANSSLKSYDNLQNEALFINDRAKLSTSLEAKRAMWSVILQNLINSVPSDVQFVSLSADTIKSPNFILQGKTTSQREVIKFKDKLDNSDFFKNVNFKSSSVASSGDTQTINFSLEFDLERLSASSGGNQ